MKKFVQKVDLYETWLLFNHVCAVLVELSRQRSAYRSHCFARSASSARLDDAASQTLFCSELHLSGRLCWTFRGFDAQRTGHVSHQHA